MNRTILALSCAGLALTASVSFAQTPDANIANAPGGAFRPRVGDYAASAYAPPSQPIPYDQLQAYLAGSPGRRSAKASARADVAATASSGNVSARTASPNPAPAGAGLATDPALSPEIGIPAWDDPSLPSNGGGVISDALHIPSPTP